MVKTPSRAVAALLAVILSIGALCRIWGFDFGLPYTQARPDETYIIDVARALLSGTAPPPAYDYPWLYMWMVSLLYFVYYLWGAALGTFHSVSDMIASWPTHWEPFFLLSRALSAAFGTATVWLVFQIGRRLWGEWTGLIAALFLSLAFLHARDSHFGTTDVTSVFFVIWAIDRLLAADQGVRPRGFAAAGLIAGLAAATKYSALLLAAPFFASYVLHVMDARGRGLRDRRFLVFGAAFLAGFSIGVPFVFTDTARFVAVMQLLWHSMRIGSPSIDPANGYAFHLALSLRHGIGLPLLITGLAGALLIVWREPRVAALLLSFPFAYYLVAGGVRNLFVRYAVPLVPFLCLCAAHAVSLVASRGSALWSPTLTRRRDVTGWTALVMGVALVVPSALAIWRFDRVVSRTDNRVMVARWFAANVPPGCSVAQSGTHFGHVQFDPGLEYREWTWDRTRSVFLSGGLPATSPPDWVLVQDSPIPSATQPVVTEWLQHDFVLVQRFRALSSNDGHLYDRQDAFFVPFARFHGTERPGPSFSVFKNARTTNCETRSAGPSRGGALRKKGRG